ncbi:MAPEG family protein [Pelagibacterium lacus]|uniref:MAPEG family protein n=1 Tax=Pelagibacterium lacus TaxID=2282655 RepID=A0A369W4I1_9HYPH|nr:MAPEG family protein [Pelagibacterium lacus]RDE09606.1 hypothetical protein DVH29_05465 [Pelagibacterium lacus]
MSFELWMIAASVLVLFAQIGIQSILLNREYGPEYNTGPRDENKPLTGKAGRAKRMLSNYLETYPAFVALALAVVVSDGSDGLTQAGAGLYILARIAYIPLYIQGVPRWRSAAFALGSLGLLAMLIGLVI